jgi:hypothetical protein
VATFLIHPHEPLSQVVFVHDYIQLVFQDERLSAFNLCRLYTDEANMIDQGEKGFCDALVRLIGRKAEPVAHGEAECLALQFEGQAKLTVLATSGSLRSLEAFEYHGNTGHVIVQQNA